MSFLTEGPITRPGSVSKTEENCRENLVIFSNISQICN